MHSGFYILAWSIDANSCCSIFMHKAITFFTFIMHNNTRSLSSSFSSPHQTTRERLFPKSEKRSGWLLSLCTNLIFFPALPCSRLSDIQTQIFAYMRAWVDFWFFGLNTHNSPAIYLCVLWVYLSAAPVCVCLMVMASAAVSCCRTLYYITRGSICYANRVPAFFLGRAARLLLHRVLRGH